MLSGTIGGLAALGSAAAWAYSSILFRELGEDVSPVGMNLANSGIGILYLSAALFAAGWEPIGVRAVLILGASGLLGVALGGVLFFRALMCLGPKRMMLLGLLCPVATVALSVVLLKERPSAAAWAGSSVIFAGLILALWKSPASDPRAKLIPGIAYSLLSALCTAVSVVLSKVGVAQVSALEATLIRHLWAAAALLLWGVSTRRIGDWLAPFQERRLARLVFFSTFIVIFGGFWLSMVALKFIDASVATVLNMTEPLFILPLAALLLKEKATAREIAGAALAFAGVALIFRG